MAHQVHQVGGVGPVENRERRLETNLGRVLPQQTSANGMEGAGPRQIDLLTAEGRRGDPLHSPNHLLGGSASTRQKQDAVRINPVEDQMWNPMGKSLRLPRSGASNHQ